MTATVAHEPAGPAELLQTPERFRRWLDQQPAAEVVGQPESLFGCPIVTYLQAQGVEHPAVGPMYVRWNLDLDVPAQAQKTILPDWAADFVKAVDHNPYQSVTAAHARAILHQVAGRVGT